MITQKSFPVIITVTVWHVWFSISSRLPRAAGDMTVQSNTQISKQALIRLFQFGNQAIIGEHCWLLYCVFYVCVWLPAPKRCELCYWGSFGFQAAAGDVVLSLELTLSSVVFCIHTFVHGLLVPPCVYFHPGVFFACTLLLSHYSDRTDDAL